MLGICERRASREAGCPAQQVSVVIQRGQAAKAGGVQTACRTRCRLRPRRRFSFQASPWTCIAAR
jgi:hypothetical protein